MFLVLICLGSLAFSAVAAELHDVRTGVHARYARLVLEFDGHVRYRVTHPPGRLEIRVSPVEQVAYLDPARLGVARRFIEHVELKHAGRELTVLVHLKRDDLRVKSSVLHRPERIVIDLYPPFGTRVDTSPKRETNASPDSLVPVARSPVESRADTVGALLETVTATLSPGATRGRPGMPPGPVERAEPSEPQSTAPSRDRVSRFVMLLTAFLLVDALVLTFYWINRKSRKRKARTTENVATSVSDFRAVLSAYQAAASTASAHKLAGQPEGRASDSAWSPPGLDLAAFPQVERALRELEQWQGASGISREMWIGQDGLEFLRNLRKRNLH